MHPTLNRLLPSDFPSIKRGELDTVQLNLGYLCNQSCLHCHVNAGPTRKELMSQQTIDEVLAFIDTNNIQTLDLTGGAPEMNPHFKYLVMQARSRGLTVIDRCNLTILEEPGYEDLAQFLADQQVQIVASLPCYSSDNVDTQRGDGVFVKSIAALQRLNALGYGRSLNLNLVYNPQDAVLPPDQQQLEQQYKQHLMEGFSVLFSQLLTITNMPIKRFGSRLISKGTFDDYMGLLKSSFRPENLSQLMCKTLISVDWQGYVYDCDFNQMLALNMGMTGHKKHISDCLELNFKQQTINIANHCYGCTAGSGSSCGGALTEG